MKNSLFWAGIILIIAGGLLFAFGQFMNFKTAELQYKQDYAAWQKQTYQRDLIKFCQQMSATTTNINWKYQNCLDQMGVSEKPTFKN